MHSFWCIHCVFVLLPFDIVPVEPSHVHASVLARQFHFFPVAIVLAQLSERAHAFVLVHPLFICCFIL